MSTNQEKLNEQLFNVVANSKDSCEARLKKLKYLVRLGADVNARLYGKSLLSKAIEIQDEEVISFLKSKGANEWVISKEEALELSQGFWDDRSNLKSLEEIKQLLKKGADVNAKDEWYGETALFVVARWGHIEVVKYLAECGADVNASTRFGITALMEAACNGHLDVVKYLAECGADLEASDKYGQTVLDIAKNWKRDDCVMILEEAQKKNLARKNQGDKTSASTIVKKNVGR